MCPHALRPKQVPDKETRDSDFLLPEERSQRRVMKSVPIKGVFPEARPRIIPDNYDDLGAGSPRGAPGQAKAQEVSVIIRPSTPTRYAHIDMAELTQYREHSSGVSLRVFGDPADKKPLYAVTIARETESVIQGRYRSRKRPVGVHKKTG